MADVWAVTDLAVSRSGSVESRAGGIPRIQLHS
jgi:UDP-N-acetylglucosamine:LPS N-acetylglucosamine transferase